jgi:uncharacterized repeat protein (TIGR03843 family)
MTEISEPLDTKTTLRRLVEWEISGMGLHPGGSNYVFVVRLEDPDRPAADPEDKDPAGAMFGIYKPSAGERPLRDFPFGTLHLRERASYLLATALGWPDIPPTVVREGPHGEGSVQLFIDADVEANYFTLRDDCLHLFEPVAMFDVLAHNADRKGGSCLKADADGRIWAIDHGLTFNPMARRRTVMFEFNGQEYPVELLDDVQRVADDLADGDSDLAVEMSALLSESEIEGLRRRAERMLQSRRFPMLDPNVNVPWPFI